MKTRLSVLAAVLLPFMSVAETTAETTVSAAVEVTEKSTLGSYMTNGVFWVLIAVIVVLLIVIVGLLEMLKASATHFNWRKKKEKNDNDNVKLSALVIFMLVGSALFGQEVEAVAKPEIIEPPFDYWGLGAMLFYLLVSIVFIEGVMIYILLRMSMMLLRVKEPEPLDPNGGLWDFKFFKRMSKTISPEEEEAIMMDHEYDGIRELDNNLPLWWKYGFYLTIIVAVVYLFNYHVFNGPSSKEEYEAEVAAAEAEMAEFKKNNAQAVDETTVQRLLDAQSISAGSGIYTQNCAPCHGAKGEGVVGPNFADDNWMHGGGIVNVFKSIKYGWPEKGMKAWEQDLKPIEIQQVASYILSLRGTNPPNAKAPEGEIYVEPGDSASALVDSAAVTKDTVKTK